MKITSNNIFTKFLLLLVLVIGWGSTAWAQTTQLPLTSGIYEIMNCSNEGSGDQIGRGYLISFNGNSSGLGLAECLWQQYKNNHPTNRNNGSTTCSYWYVHRHVDGSYAIVSLSDLGGNTTPRLLQVGSPSSLTTDDVAILITDSPNNNHARDGKKAALIANKSESNQYISAACGTRTNASSNPILRNTNYNDGGCPFLFLPVEETTLNAQQLAIRDKYLERFARLTDNVTLIFQDGNGNPLPDDQVVVYTPTTGSPVNLTKASSPYNFGNVLFNPTQFSVTDAGKILETRYNEETQTLTFTITTDPYLIQFSSAPSATEWAADTKWFTWRNNRNAKGYMSTQDAGQYLDVNANLTIKNGADAKGDRGGLWAFVTNGSGINIYNNAYGPDFILGITGSGGNARMQMYPKDDIPSGVTTLFSTTESNVTDGVSHGYCFVLGTSGSNHLNEQDGYPGQWNPNNVGTMKGDEGSSFRVEAIDENLVNALPKYDVYKSSWMGSAVSGSISYGDATKVFGRRGTANNGQYLILKVGSPVAISDFSINLSDDDCIVQSITNSETPNHKYKTLVFYIKDKNATDEWTVKAPDEYLVNFAGTAYTNGEHFYLRPNVKPNALDITINAPAEKFVWGPIINENARTVTYEVRDRAADLNTGWYQLQLALSESTITGIANKIHHDEGNINTSANTLYLASATMEPGDNRIFKVTAVPDNAGEAATYVHITNNGNNNYTLTNVNTGAAYTGAFTFDGGRLTKSSGWSLEDNPTHPLEGPYIKPTGSYGFAFNVVAVDESQMKVYKIVTNNPTVQINISNNAILGNKVVKNGGYIFLPKNASAPTMSQFSVYSASDTITNVVVGAEEGGVTPINVTLEVRKSWKAIIKGSAKEDGDRVIYKDVEFKDGEKMPVPDGTKPSAMDFKTNVSDRFVWGPIINEKDSTVTFEIKTPVNVTANTDTPLATDGWYQFVLVPNPSNGDASFINTINNASTRAKSRKGSYIYMFNADTEFLQGSANYYPAKFAAVPVDGEQATSFFYVTANSVSPKFLSINGHNIGPNGHVGAEGVRRLEAKAQNVYGVFRWSNYNTGSDEQPYIGASGEGCNYYVRAVKVDPTTMYDVYKVNLPAGCDKVRYAGSENHGINEVFNNGYFFLTKGSKEPTKDNFRVDGISTISSISISDDKVITFTVTTPSYNNEIIHKQNRYYDYMETDPNKPVEGFIKEGQGWNVRGGIREQNTSLFEIPVYLKQGTSMTSYLPTDQLASYQRWYNWDTDGQVDTQVLTNSLSGYTQYNNGYAIFRGAQNGNGQATVPTLALPATETAYNVGLDISRWTDYVQNPSGASGSAIEPTLGMRIVYQVRDAKIIANAIKDSTTNKNFFETHNISLPNVQYGSRASRLEDRTLSTTLPMDMDLNNYWGFNSSGTGNDNLVQLTGDGQLRVELVDGGSNIQNCMMIPGSGSAASGNISRVDFNRGHFVLFQYPDDGHIEPNATATINVYMTSGNVEYKLVQFNLTFIENAHPVVVTELKDSGRHPDALATSFGAPVSDLTFDQTPNSEFGSTEGGVYYPDYRYPLDYQGASYAFGARNTGRSWAASRGEYALQSVASSSGQAGTPRLAYYPVTNYFRSMKDPSTAFGSKEEGAYQLYIDAADQPGKIASIALNGTLCPGSRLYCYGYIGCTSGGTSQNPTSVLINVMGRNRETGKEELLYSYCPGIITLRGYAEDGRTIYSTSLGNSSSYSQRTGNEDLNYWAPWQQIGFSFTIDALTASKMSGYSFQIMNNAYNSTGGDTMLDDFQIFVNPPKGSVDFTTPLCSDKVRHAKIHADYDMLKNINGNINEEVEGAVMTTTYCFLDAELFDNFEENGMKIGDMFEMDDRGNHNLKPEYSEIDQKVIDIINHAFRQALVGSRYTKDSDKDDHGYHSYEIPLDFESIPVYNYQDSKTEEVYREVDKQGVRRLVFKENVVRGEMQMVPAEKGNEEKHPAYWPYMRPSRTYYLVFSPIYATQETIDGENTATKVFGIQENCSFFGKFTTKDPLHVILDNADIESDLPIRAVCHGETTYFSFDMPTLKLDKPIYDEENCISDQSLDGKLVPSSHGTKHYRYEPIFNTPEVTGVIKNMPYDWWFGGKYSETITYRGTIEEYTKATHPTIKYDHNVADPSHTHTHAADYKKHGEPVDISLAMEDFRFYYPDFGKPGNNDWDTLRVHDYNNESGYSLLRSEINAIKDLVEKNFIVLHRNTYDMPMTYEEAENLQIKELNDMMESEMNTQILTLALELNDETIKHLLPLKRLEGTILEMLSPAGKRELTFEEYASLSHEQLRGIATTLKSQGKLSITDEQISTMPESELHKAVETVLRVMSDSELSDFAKANFPDIGHEKRAYLVIRALNLLSKEVVARLTPEEQQNTTITRAKLREMMISIFSQQEVVVLRKMWKDTSAKLTEEDREKLLEDKEHPGTKLNPDTMDADGLAVLVEDALAAITNKMIADMMSDKYVNFTLIPIMPSQVNFVDEPYIFCPEPRGVRIRLTSKEPVMLDGFADMAYPSDMTNVPVRLGLPQIKETYGQDGKTLCIPVRGLLQAVDGGVQAMKLAEETGYGNNLFLTMTDDPQYQQTPNAGTMSEAKNDQGFYLHMVGTIESMTAIYPTRKNPTPDNYLIVKFKDSMRFREGYTYRIGINFMEYDGAEVPQPTISCYGTMLIDLKIVPEYQKWTATVNSDWTNDRNWTRADRTDLHAGNAATGEKIDPAATSLTDDSYLSNEANGTTSSFVPMYFTNVLVEGDATTMPELYDGLTPASRQKKEFLKGLKATSTADIIYDMEVAPSNGSWFSGNNYECTLYGTYTANGLTFEPGAQLLNAQLLDYRKAWVEYELDVNRWYTLSSPLQNTFAGEWYAPTAGGRQQTPHFYGINYRSDLNHRFQPAFYQRSWDREGNNPVWQKISGKQEAFVKADWSHVYNDVTKEYSEGAFSVKVADEHMASKPAEGKSLVRMPKADTKYTYYDINNATGAKPDDALAVTASRSRLWTDKLKTQESFTQTIKNMTAGNNYFLVGNPFMTAMDMDAFFAANPGLEKKYWIVSADQQHVSVRGESTNWISTSGDKYVAPLQGFFVKATEASQTTLTVTYKADMQAPQGTKPVLKARGAQTETRNIIRLTATRGEASSTAVILLDEQANDDYVATEDCETFIDGNLYDMPTVFTSAQGVAQTINVRRTLDRVPVGMISADDSEAILRFDLRDSHDRSLFLFDSETQEYTEISDGTEVTMSGNAVGRYFLCKSPMEEDLNAEELDGVKKGVWTVGGAYLGKSVKNLRPGIYIVDGVKMVIR